MPKTIFRVENGVLALELVDTLAVGYLPTWQAPDGKTLPAVVPADYDTATESFQCQTVTGVLTSTPQSTTENLDGTWCDLPEVVTIAGEDTFSVALDVYQDANKVGLAAYLYEHRGKKAYAYFGMGLNSPDPPRAIGVVTLSSISIGGGRQAARAQVTFPFDRAPDIQFGTATEWRIVPGDGSAATDGPPAGFAAAEADEAESVDAVITVTATGATDLGTAQLERDLRAANRAVGRELATVVRKAQRVAIKSTGRGTLSGMRVTLGAKTAVFAGAQRVTVDVTATPPGPWSIVERGRGPVRARGRALAIPGYPRRSARGTKGRRGTWDAATAAAQPDIDRAIEAIYDDALEG